MKNETKKISLDFEFEVKKDKKNSFYMRMNVKGMMDIIERELKSKGIKDAKLLLDEYAKLYIANLAKIKEMPLSK